MCGANCVCSRHCTLVTTLTLDSWSLTGPGDRRVTCALCCSAPGGGTGWPGSGPRPAPARHRPVTSPQPGQGSPSHLHQAAPACAAQAPSTDLVPWEMFASKVFCAPDSNRTGTEKKYFRLENTIREQIVNMREFKFKGRICIRHRKESQKFRFNMIG